VAMAEPVAAAAVGESAAAGSATAGGGAPLRTPRSGGSTMAVDGENRPRKPKPKPKPKAAPAVAPAAPAEEPAPAEEQAPDLGPRRSLPNPGGVVREGSWVVLGFLGWVWVALPFIKSGPGGVRDVLLAKFVNRTPEGK
jgi:hypothetical protein